MDEFRNEPLTDFTKRANSEAMQAAIADVLAMADRRWPLLIAGKEVTASETFVSRNPSNPSQTLGTFAKAEEVDAENALAAAWDAFDGWKKTIAEDRALILTGAARNLRERRFLLNAAMVVEAGKSWVEADADTAEAIDFLEYYAREAVRMAGNHPVTQIPSERSELRYVPMGAGVAIPPWNFPCAIFLGVAAGPVAAGNTVVLKPASDTPLTGYLSVQCLIDAGLPPGVVNLVTGPGAVAGEFLVKHPKTRFINFTGSMEVGLKINELAGKAADGQKWIKRVVIEMGGKNAILVDEDCDFDAAVAAVVASAYGFQGQKCSAGSRAIVLAPLYDRFVEAVVEKTRAIPMGDPVDPNTVLGPVINEAAVEKIMGYIEIGKSEAKLATGGNRAAADGYFIEPTVFTDVPPDARIAQEEIFGPVLSILKADDFGDALAIANGTDYGLTGAVFSNDRAHLDLAGNHFEVGNLYYNRKCTGALVGVHPFGGFHLSGTDAKTGSRDYLPLFMQAKSISEVIAGR